MRKYTSTRAALRRSIGDFDGAARDFAEVEEIAELGPMQQFLCEIALERARLAFPRAEGLAPLNGVLSKDNPPKPEVPKTDEANEQKEEAAKQIAIVADIVESGGYHGRDEELGEL